MRTSTGHGWQLKLLRQWELLCDGDAIVALGGFGKRVVAGVALAGPADPELLAELLMPGWAPEDSAGRLAAEVATLRERLPGLLDDAAHGWLALAPEVWVDLRDLLREADFLMARGQAGPALIGELRDAELLPGWPEDWALHYRERVRVFRLAALEAIARQSLLSDDPATAAAASRSAAAIEPLRESAHVLLIRAQVLAGNLREAYFVHEAFRRRLLKQTGHEPSPALTGALGLASGTPRATRVPSGRATAAGRRGLAAGRRNGVPGGSRPAAIPRKPR